MRSCHNAADGGKVGQVDKVDSRVFGGLAYVMD
jgi:hypothetical protein